MADDFNITDNSDAVRHALELAKQRALEIIGTKAAAYAADLAPVDTGNLKNSLTHRVDGDTVLVGTNVQYAPYVELGTGPHYTPPPEWMENNAERGQGLHGGFVTARPYLRPAIVNHKDEYEYIFENELKR